MLIQTLTFVTLSIMSIHTESLARLLGRWIHNASTLLPHMHAQTRIKWKVVSDTYKPVSGKTKTKSYHIQEMLILQVKLLGIAMDHGNL